MRVRRLAALAGVVVIAVAAGAGVAAAVRGVSRAAADEMFLATAHQADLFAIDGGRIAEQRAADAVVRRLAAELATDHTRLDGDVRALAARLFVALPDQPSAAQRAQLVAVAAASGTSFDSAWLRLQVAAHQESLAAAQAEVAQGSNADVKALAERAAPLLRTHLLEFEQALGAGTPSGVNAGDGGQAASRPPGSGTLGWALLGLAAAFVAVSLVRFGPRRYRAAPTRTAQTTRTAQIRTAQTRTALTLRP